MKVLLIIGARGFGREVCQAVFSSPQFLSGDIIIKGFLDDKTDALDGYKGNWPPILSSVEDYVIQPNDVFFCALGQSSWRKHYADLIIARGGRFISIFHPAARISPVATFGDGCFVGPFSCVSPNVTVGKNVIIHAFSDLGHDSVVGDFATIESYVFLGGYSSVGELSTMHTKSSILPHKSIGRKCEVGIGSVVMRKFKDGVHVFGNPARITDL